MTLFTLLMMPAAGLLIGAVLLYVVNHPPKSDRHPAE